MVSCFFRDNMGNYFTVKYNCASNGEGVRTAVYLSGCTLHCKGCFNKIAWDFNSGNELTEEVIDKILKSIEPDYIQGISILGGEPFDNIESLEKIIKSFRKKFGVKKDIWVWTGYNIEALYSNDILYNIDVLIDGKFDINKIDPSLRFRGSSNQRILYRGKDF